MSTLGPTASVSTHVPTDPVAREAISPYLDREESLLWAGRPNFLGVSIHAILLGLCLMLALLIGTHKQVVLCWVVLPPLRALATHVRSGAVYGVTDRRVLCFCMHFHYKKEFRHFRCATRSAIHFESTARRLESWELEAIPPTRFWVVGRVLSSSSARALRTFIR